MKKSVLVLLASTALLAPTRTDAFGPVCVPTIRNCMCTHMIPCPVIDPAENSSASRDLGELRNALQKWAETKKPQAMLTKAVSGQLSGTIPGINAVGIDINALVNGDFSSLGIAGVEELMSKLTTLGIDVTMVQKILSGKVSPSDFLAVAMQNGLDLSKLAAVGISPETLNAIMSGAMNPSQILDLAKGMDFMGPALSAMGISPELLQGIASGKIEPGRLLDVAKAAGLNLDGLAAIGLDQNAILAIANGAGAESMMGILQKAGLGNSMLADLGIDAETLGNIASGKLPPEAITAMLARSGIDPRAIIIPGRNGPISVGGGPGSPASSILSIPVAAIPGLDEILTPSDRVVGAGPSVPQWGGLGWGGNAEASAGDPRVVAPPRRPDATGASLPGEASANAAIPGRSPGTGAAICTPPTELISVKVPPHEFGDDVAEIDFGLSQGDLILYGETIADGMRLASITQAFGIGRTIQVRPLVTEALDNMDSFQQLIENSKFIESDLEVNDTLKTQLLMTQAETTSLLTAYASMRAAREINETTITVLPLFPNDSRFLAMMEMGAKATSQPVAEAAAATIDVSRDQAHFSEAARTAILYHELIKSGKDIEATLPEIISHIERHEDYKDLRYGFEQKVHGMLSALYIDPDAAWAKVKPEIESSAGSYLDPAKWGASASGMRQLDNALRAQKSSTAYGRRKPNPVPRRKINGIWDPDYLPYTDAADWPYSYPEADQLYGSNDPARIKKSSGSLSIPPTYRVDGLLQYYQSAIRREEYFGEIRRGPPEASMSGNLWKELVTSAPECLIGPLPSTAENLSARPDLFDVAPDCSHLMWEGGDDGDYIPHTDLGGMDSSLWMSRVTLGGIASRTGGEAASMSIARAAINEAKNKQIATTMRSLGHREAATHVDAVTETLRQMLDDKSFTRSFRFPQD